MTLALVLTAMTILDWMTLYTAAKVYLIVVTLAYVFTVWEALHRERP